MGHTTGKERIGSGGIFVGISVPNRQAAATILSLRFDAPFVQDNTGDKKRQLIDVNNHNRRESVETQPEDCRDCRQTSETKGHGRRERCHCDRESNVIDGIRDSIHSRFGTIGTIKRTSQNEDVVKSDSENDKGQEL